MEIYTGYYAKMKKYKELGLIPVSIAFATPIWYEGEICFELAPPCKLISGYKNGIISKDDYAKKYKNFLKTVNWAEVIEKLYSISDKYDGKDLVLCCYEKSSDFCHRHILAEYLTKSGMKVKECDVWKG